MKVSRNSIIFEKSKIGITKDNIKWLYQFEVQSKYDLLIRDKSKEEEGWDAKNKDTISKSMKEKITNLLKTSQFKSIVWKDPKEQTLANSIMEKQTKNLCKLYYLSLVDINIQDSSFYNGDDHGKSSVEIDFLQSETKNIDFQIESWKQKIKSLIYKELKRLLKEFKQNKYELRYNTTIQKVTAALVGQELDVQDISKILGGQKQLKWLS